jgi:serine/threonine-protein kinase PRP4
VLLCHNPRFSRARRASTPARDTQSVGVQNALKYPLVNTCADACNPLHLLAERNRDRVAYKDSMAASRANTASAGEATEQNNKANTLSHSRELAIDGTDRMFGLEGASDNYGKQPKTQGGRMLNDPGHNYRARSRSPSPYRRKPSRSPSPYRRKHDDRSPSPYRHGRGNRGGHSNDSRSSHNKRKASPPPRPGRPDKRYHADGSRQDDRRQKTQYDDSRAGSRQSGQKDRAEADDRRFPSPISYADNEQSPPVPGFHDVLNGRNSSRQQNDNAYRSRPHAFGSNKLHGQSSVAAVRPGPSRDVKMYVPPLAQYYRHLRHPRRTDADDEPDLSVTLAVEETVPSEESREEKKRKWAAKRAQLAAQEATGHVNNPPLLQKAIINNATESATSNVASPAAEITNSTPVDSPRYMDSQPGSPDVMIIDKQDVASEGDSPSAANYDPTQDMLDDRARAERKAQQSELSTTAYDESDPNLQPTIPTVEKAAPKNKKKKKEFDMFAFDDDEEDDEDEEQDTGPAKGTVLDAKLLDNWDDPDGYYKIISNELVNAGQYRMIKILGRGVFANVAQAEDVKDQTEGKNGKVVAIKIVRRNDLMRKASQKEMDFLRKLNEADPQDKRHIIRLLGSFDHKGHLCIVFEQMSKNLRDLLKEDTNGHGLSLQAVKMYARQMFSGLQHLRECNIIHLDLKPDNILVSHDKKSVKLCDLGTAADKRDVIDRTEYLVSRFYRAPEIVLDMEYGYAIDMWAIGCTIYELWTGKILFTGRSNNQMIKAFLECLGWPSEKLLKKGQPASVLMNFELGPPLKFISREVDPNGNVGLHPLL